MIVRKHINADVMANAHKVDARNLYNSPDLMVSIITLKPGEALKQHITPVDVAFYVLDGTGTVEIGEEKQTVGKDTLIESPKGIMHCWYNQSGGTLKFMVIKAPRPTEKTVFIDN
ncbi:MAG: cupin domain-containing protein [Kiritimatiellia bacterium]